MKYRVKIRNPRIKTKARSPIVKLRTFGVSLVLKIAKDLKAVSQ